MFFCFSLCPLFRFYIFLILYFYCGFVCSYCCLYALFEYFVGMRVFSMRSVLSIQYESLGSDAWILSLSRLYCVACFTRRITIHSL